MSVIGERAVILLPVHKPGEELIELCRSLHGARVVMVDSGSGKGYDELFRRAAEYGEVLRMEKNRGRGSALKHGLRHILVNAAYENAEFIVTADVGYSGADILRAAEETAEKGGLILGTRKGGVSAAKKLGRGLTDLVFRIGAGKGVSDTLTGLRGFSREMAAEYAALKGERFEYEMNMLFNAAEDKTAVTEMEAKEEGTAPVGFRFHPIFDTVRVYWAIFMESRTLKFLFSSGVAFIIDYVLLNLLANSFSFHGAMEISAVAAWILSSLTNFFLNRNFVFRSNAPLRTAFPEYYGLAAIVFLLKTFVLLELLVRVIGVPLAIAKPVAEVVFFVSNYFIQKKFIFKNKEK